MTDVLLTHCNHLFHDRKQVKKMQPYPPLQTLIAAACLRRDGWTTAVLDTTFDEPLPAFRRSLDAHQPELVFICEDHFNFLTKMCLAKNRELAFEMGAMARDQGVRVVVASSDASDHADLYLDRCADFVIFGDVEETASELVSAVLNRRPVAGVSGIAFRDSTSGGVRRTKPRPPLANLDTIPVAALDLIDVEPYRRAWIAAHGYFSLNAVSSRGCPFRCNWCAKPVFGSNYRVRSAAAVAEEMHTLKNTVRPDQIWFGDDIFGLAPSWCFEFAAAVEQRSAQIPFKMQSRCDLMTRNTVAALRRAGCAEVWMGAESGSQKILDAMDKGIQVRDVYEACRNLRSHGIRAGLFLQFGYPGETWDDIEKTIDMVRAVEPDDVGISVAYPLPGTKFHEMVSLQLGPKKNWNDSDDLSIMFRGRYSSDFYVALRDAIHAEVRREPVDEVESLWAHVRALEPTCTTPQPAVV